MIYAVSNGVGKSADAGGVDVRTRGTHCAHDIAALVAALSAPHTLQGQAALRWVKAAPFPKPEEELYAVTVNGKMYVIGGFGYMPFGNPPGLVYEYDPGPDKWTKKKILPQRVHHQAQAVYNNKIYVFGGCKMGIFGTDAVTNVWEYDPRPTTTARWRRFPVRGVRRRGYGEQQDLSDRRHRAV
jgi:hypothetical protein